MSLTPDATEHTAKYHIKAGRLPQLLGIKVPRGASAAIEHVSDSSGRATAIGPDHMIVIRIIWTEEGEQKT